MKNNNKKGSSIIYAESLEKIANSWDESVFNKPNYSLIPPPVYQSEAEIQTALWVRLQSEGIKARMQVSSLDKSDICKGRFEQSKSIFDIVIYRDKKAIAIVEVKKIETDKAKLKIARVNNQEQAKKYCSYHIPVIYCIGYGMVDRTIEKILAIP